MFKDNSGNIDIGGSKVNFKKYSRTCKPRRIKDKCKYCCVFDIIKPVSKVTTTKIS